MHQRELKPLEWVGSSREDLKEFPVEVRKHAGFALYQAQAGFKHRDAKPLKGMGSDILEVVSRHDGDTYRAVYTVRFKAAVYVLHAFVKKTQQTSKADIELARTRFKQLIAARQR